MGVKGNNNIKIIKKAPVINTGVRVSVKSILDFFNETVPTKFTYPLPIDEEIFNPITDPIGISVLAGLKHWKKVREALNPKIPVLDFIDFILSIAYNNDLNVDKKPRKGKSKFVSAAIVLGLLDYTNNKFTPTDKAEMIFFALKKMDFCIPFDWETIINGKKNGKPNSVYLGLKNHGGVYPVPLIIKSTNGDALATTCRYENSNIIGEVVSLFTIPEEEVETLEKSMPPETVFKEEDLDINPKLEPFKELIQETMEIAAYDNSVELEPYVIIRGDNTTVFKGYVNGKKIFVNASNSSLYLLQKMYGKNLEFYVVDEPTSKSTERYSYLFCKHNGKLVHTEEALLVDANSGYWRNKNLNEFLPPIIQAYENM